jgi:hypothetical protein
MENQDNQFKVTEEEMEALAAFRAGPAFRAVNRYLQEQSLLLKETALLLTDQHQEVLVGESTKAVIRISIAEQLKELQGRQNMMKSFLTFVKNSADRYDVKKKKTKKKKQ